MTNIKDGRMIARAISQRWPIPPEYRNAAIRRLMRTIADPNSTSREATSAIKALLAAEQQNQSDEHKVIDVHVETRHDKLDGIAADLGIDLGAIEDAEREAGRRIDGIEGEGVPEASE